MGFTSLSLGPLTKPLLCRNSTCMCCGHKGCLAGRKMLSRSCFPMGFSSLSHAQNACVNSEEIVKDKLLIDCGPDQECVLGGIVALGKFEALHRGHRELAIQASKAGTPFLLSFIGMAEFLGWVHKEPIVAKCDRKRVLASWAPHCGNVVPLEYHVDFSRVRHLSPRQFVEKLSDELGITGVVAGENYRFGYKAAGDASELVRLCNEYGLHSYIVKSVMDKLQPRNGASTINNGKEKGQISSTRVRHTLSLGDMDYVAELLGRKHRLVMTNNEGNVSRGRLSLPFTCLLNQPPKEGSYDNCTLYVDGFVGVCDVVIDATHIHVRMDSWPLLTANCLISIEFSGVRHGEIDTS